MLDVENLRLHYARTLRALAAALRGAAASGVAEMFDERFVRMWRLYLAGSEAAFRTGSLQLFQVVFAPGGVERGAVDTARLYAEAAGLTWNAATS